MGSSLKQTCFSIWRNKYERKISTGVFKPIFTRYIGVEDTSDYCNVLKTFAVNFTENEDKTLIFDGSIELKAEFELISSIDTELKTMDINNISKQDIILFNDMEVNDVFLKALEYVIPLAIKNERFFNESVRNSFITKLIVWGYIYLKDKNLKDDVNPKCLYYGIIQRHEIYFLMVLHLMGFDVLYINPTKDEYWREIDLDNLSSLHQDMGILAIDSLESKIQNGSIIEKTESLTKQLKKDIENELFTDTGVFRDWQFRSGYTNALFMDTVMEDLNIYWKEHSKVRQGFKVEGSTVTVPVFFQKIDGMFSDSSQYSELVAHCTSALNAMVVSDKNLSNDIEVTDEMYQLMFCQLSDGTFDIEAIKKLPIYRLGKYSLETQNLILNKFNELLLDKSLYSFSLSTNDILQLLVLILHLKDDIVRLVDNFDFTSNIPKIVIFLNKEDKLSDNMILLLGYLHKIGMDIVIFNPSGLFNMSHVIRQDRMNTTRLQTMKYDADYTQVISKKKRFFERFLK